MSEGPFLEEGFFEIFIILYDFFMFEELFFGKFL